MQTNVTAQLRTRDENCESLSWSESDWVAYFRAFGASLIEAKYSASQIVAIQEFHGAM